MNTPKAAPDLPSWSVEQPKTYRTFRLVIEETTEDSANTRRAADEIDLVNYVMSLPSEFRSRLKAAL